VGGDPVVTNAADVKAHARSEVVVEGVYTQIDVRRMKVDPDELFAGHAGIVLDDGTRVFLEPPHEPQGRRSTEERERFEHERVRAAGTLLSRIPGRGAAIRAPCLVDVTSVELAP